MGSAASRSSIESKLSSGSTKKEDDNILSDMDCDDVEEWKSRGVYFLKTGFLYELVLLSAIKKNANIVLNHQENSVNRLEILNELEI